METTQLKKIFILTGEASGDKLASKAINDLKILNEFSYLNNQSNQ